MSVNVSRRQERLSRILVWLLSSALVLAGLYLVNRSIPRAEKKDGVYWLSEEQLQQELWLLSDASGQETSTARLVLELEGSIPCSLYLGSETGTERLLANGRPLDFLKIGRQAVGNLPPEERTVLLEYSWAQGNPLLLSSNPICIGGRELVLQRVQREENSRGLLQGFFLFSTLFALTMYMFKRSERYLLPYAVHALIPQFMAQLPFLKTVFGSIAGGQALLRFLGSPGVNAFIEYSYVFLNAVIHWLIYREFVEDRIGKHPYINYLTVCYVPLAVLTLFLPETLGGFRAFYLFYFIMYLLEGLMLLGNPVREGDEFFVLTLIAGWAVSLVFWMARTANNLGYISYPFSLGNQVALGYTFSFLICINGKFARKFHQADRLLVETRRLNDGLEQQVAERTKDLQTAMDELKTMQDNKNQFVANIIHNLKTPLFSLKGYAELLQDQTAGDDPETREYLGYIVGNVDYVQKLIQQLLLFDRLEEKRIRFQFAPILLSSFLEQLRHSAETAGREKNLHILVENELPADYSFEGDRLYLEQAVLNLLENAIRHSAADGSITLRAEELSADSGEKTLCLSVQDYGEGMSETVKSHIFERGYSHHDDGGKSSGLGLNIALCIAREHGGDLQVQSEHGEGSCFLLSLPRERK